MECYSPLPEDQAGEKEGERTEGYGRGTTAWLFFLASKLRYLNYGTPQGYSKMRIENNIEGEARPIKIEFKSREREQEFQESLFVG